MRLGWMVPVLMCAAIGVFAAEHEDVTALLEEAVQGNRYPGVQYAVVGPEGVLYEYYGGMADVAAGRVMDAATTMMAYSMTKTFTAVAVLQLVDKGMLSLSDSAKRYVPSLPYGPEVTVRHLLAQTSGIPNPMPLRWVHPATADPVYDEDRELARILTANNRLSFRPGDRYAYSNISYWILGEVIEAASGLPYRVYMERNVLLPLGLGPSDAGFTIPDLGRHAHGYLARRSIMNLLKGFLVDRALIGDREGSWVRIREHYPNGSAFGGLILTTRAVAAFLQDQLRDASQLLSPAARRELYTQQQSNDGRPIPMTLGWHVGRIGSETFYYKEGGGGGYHCEMRVYPASGVASVIMTNETGATIPRLQEQADRYFLRGSIGGVR